MRSTGRSSVTYYEELGVPPNAPVEEIRQAYKLMARLLHPDAQVDPKLKALAEGQMKRLGEIASVLVDPAKRRNYDESLSPCNERQVPGSRGVPQLTVVAPVDQPKLAQFAVRNW